MQYTNVGLHWAHYVDICGPCFGQMQGDYNTGLNIENVYLRILVPIIVFLSVANDCLYNFV